MDGLVGIAGDFNPKDQTHMATNRALQDIGFRFEWVPTTDLERKSPKRLAPYRGLWIAPASPYRSMRGAPDALRYARERGVPLVGT